RSADARDLVERHLLAVGLDPDVVHHAGRGTAGADVVELVGEVLQRLVHVLARVVEDAFERVVDHGRARGVWANVWAGSSSFQWTRVPVGSPRSTRSSVPGRSMLKTTMGRPDSWQSVIAVRSITRRLRRRTSIPLMDSNRCALGSCSGSAVKTPSTRVPFRMTSASTSAARRLAAVSVVK